MRRKIFLSLIILLSIFLVGQLIAFNKLGNLTVSLRNIIYYQQVIIKTTNAISKSLDTAQLNFAHYPNEAFKQVKEATAEIKHLKKISKTTILIDFATSKKIDALADDISKFYSNFEEKMNEKNIRAHLNKLIVDCHEIQINTEHLRKGLYQDQRKKSIQTILAAFSSQWDLLATLFLALFVAIGIGLILSGSITEPIKELIKGTKIIGRGDLTYQIKINTKDELSMLAESFNQMTNRLKMFQDLLIRRERNFVIGHMVEHMTHTLNNPLTSISSYLYLCVNKLKGVLEPKTDQEMTVFFQQMKEAVERCKTITQNLAHLPKIQAEKQIQSLRINEVLNETIEIINDLAVHQGVKITREFDENISNFKADPEELKQVFLNIIKNAFEAMAKGGELKITAKAINHPMAAIEIIFFDKGIGINYQNISKVFDPFFTTKDSERYTGLGLTLSQQILKEYRGYIELKSEANHGTEVKIILPFE